MEKIKHNLDIMNNIMSYNKSKSRRDHEERFAPTILYIKDFFECYGCETSLTLFPLCSDCQGTLWIKNK